MRYSEIKNEYISNKQQWIERVTALGAKVEEDNEGMTANFGPGFKICGEWSEFRGNGVIYSANVDKFQKSK